MNLEFFLLFHCSEIIGCGGIYFSEFDPRFALAGCRTWMHQDYRNRSLPREFLLPAQKQWAQERDASAVGITFNEYNKNLINTWKRTRLGEQRLPRQPHHLFYNNFNEVDFWEMHYISLYKSWGFDLKNGTIGGEGGTGLKHTEETKMKMSLMRKGKQLSLGRKHSDETKRKIGIKSSQKVFDIEYREKLRLSSTGRKFTLEQKINHEKDIVDYY